eukprot:5444271-Pleurochrysis_carterae.AAC.1
MAFTLMSETSFASQAQMKASLHIYIGKLQLLMQAPRAGQSLDYFTTTKTTLRKHRQYCSLVIGKSSASALTAAAAAMCAGTQLHARNHFRCIEPPSAGAPARPPSITTLSLFAAHQPIRNRNAAQDVIFTT